MIVINGMEMPINCQHCPCSDDESRFCRAANKYIPMLGKPEFCPLATIEERKTGRWIPCSERLPEIGQSVLLSVGGMYSAEGCLREDGDWAQFRWDAIQRKDMVGAWKPLPEPYKGE